MRKILLYFYDCLMTYFYLNDIIVLSVKLLIYNNK